MKQNTERRIVFFLFFASGTSGLIYEIIWLRILSRVIGVTTYATSITLAAFMLGLALGSFSFGKLADKSKNHLRTYALLQLTIAAAAVITPVILNVSIPLYKYIYQVSNQNTALIMPARAVVSFLVLLIPAILMGGTLPILTSYLVIKEGAFGRNFSLLYGLNTLGAVLGVILSGFITIGAIGEWNTIFIAVFINLAVGISAVFLQKISRRPENIAPGEIVKSDAAISPYPAELRKIVLFAVMISGFTSLAYEVIWTRQLILFLKTSIYAFSGMLAVFLTGLAVGSICVNRWVDKLRNPLFVFGNLELGIGILSIGNLYLLGYLDTNLATRILSPVILVFPLTFFFGAIFPLAAFCYARCISQAGSSVGTLYAANTIGNVAGSLLTGLVFISLFGSSKTVILLGFVNVAIGLFILQLERNKPLRLKLKYLLVIPAALLLSAGFWGKDPFLMAVEKKVAEGAYSYQIFYNRETVEGTVTSFIINNSKKGLWTNSGVGYCGLNTETKLMAHLPIMLAENPKKILVICFGMGTSVRSACSYDNLDITAVELVPEVFDCFKYHHHDANEILKRKNLRLIAEDGRNFLLLSSEKYDVITVDPSYPIYGAGTVNLYTQEFLSLCREHLTPGGVMCLWFPQSPPDDTRAILKTFHSVFPDLMVWVSPNKWGLYLTGAPTPIKNEGQRIKKALSNPKVLSDLNEYEQIFTESTPLMNLLIIDKTSIAKGIEDAALITDNNPYTEFPLWRCWLAGDSQTKDNHLSVREN